MEESNDMMDVFYIDATMIPKVKPGHNIAGAPVILHQLEDVSSNDDKLSFAVQIVRQEMNIFLKGEPSFGPCDITILYDKHYSESEQKSISDMLKQDFKLDTTTIKDHVRYGNNDKVVVGNEDDCMSHEAPCVIFIGDGVYLNNPYVLLSRARARLTMISSSKNYYLYNSLEQLEHVSLFTWVHEHDGNFVRK